MALDTLGNSALPDAFRFFSQFIDNVADTEAPQVSGQLQNFMGRFDTTIPPELQSTARNLKAIARAFANSEYREQVLQQAVEISNNLSANSLFDILRMILTVTDTRQLAEHIVVAFYFLFDILCRMASRSWGQLRQAFDWCYEGIRGVVDPLVENAGGWGSVFQSVAAGGIFTIIAGMVVGGAVVLGRLIAG